MSTPLQTIVTSDIGRGQQLKFGPGNNQYVRVSDFNPVVDYINDTAGVNQTSATASSSAATLNTRVGSITSEALTTAALGTETLTITNSEVTANSIVLVVPTAYTGTLATDGIPVITKVTASAGSFVVLITNVHAANALDGTVTFKFVVL